MWKVTDKSKPSLLVVKGCETTRNLQTHYVSRLVSNISLTRSKTVLGNNLLNLNACKMQY